jgi:hypothetical protein
MTSQKIRLKRNKFFDVYSFDEKYYIPFKDYISLSYSKGEKNNLEICIDLNLQIRYLNYLSEVYRNHRFTFISNSLCALLKLVPIRVKDVSLVVKEIDNFENEILKSLRSEKVDKDIVDNLLNKIMNKGSINSIKFAKTTSFERRIKLSVYSNAQTLTESLTSITNISDLLSNWMISVNF